MHIHTHTHTHKSMHTRTLYMLSHHGGWPEIPARTRQAEFSGHFLAELPRNSRPSRTGWNSGPIAPGNPGGKFPGFTGRIRGPIPPVNPENFPPGFPGGIYVPISARKTKKFIPQITGGICSYFSANSARKSEHFLPSNYGRNLQLFFLQIPPVNWGKLYPNLRAECTAFFSARKLWKILRQSHVRVRSPQGDH